MLSVGTWGVNWWLVAPRKRKLGEKPRTLTGWDLNIIFVTNSKSPFELEDLCTILIFCDRSFKRKKRSQDILATMSVALFNAKNIEVSELIPVRRQQNDCSHLTEFN